MIEDMMLIDGDVLAILDSCFATAAAMSGLNTEYLVASAFESPASAVIQRSFTRRLIDLLKSQIYTEVTIAQIHAKLVHQANQPSSVLDYTPIHVSCKDKPSITLRPLQNLPRELADLKKRDELSDGKVLVSI
jgi:AICAR transformylase/IMP cyclohydrolase PurH